MNAPRIEKCSNCKDNYWIEDLYWADKGAMTWLCQACFDVSHKWATV